MEKKSKNEREAYSETDRLKKELEALTGRNSIGYSDLMRIDEINERLQELDPLPDEFSAEEEWDKFEKEFLRRRRDTSEIKKKNKSTDRTSKKFKPGRLRLLGTAAAAVIVIGLFSTMLVGADFFSGFHFLKDDAVEIRYNEDEPAETEGFISFDSAAELQDFLDFKLMLPKYLPEGYKESYVIYSSENNSAVIRYYKEDSDEEIVQIIRKVTEGKTISMPRDDTPPYTVIHNNIEFNVYGNGGESFIEWTYNGYSYYLSGVLDEDEIRKIIERME